MYKIIFLGTSEFAVPSLRALLDDPRFDVIAVITQPDKPVGRHAELTAPPVKRLAEQAGIPIFQPQKLSELNPSLPSAVSRLPSHIDAFIVVSYGKILPQWLLDIPKRGVVNVHGSLLPRWRGASPIQAAIKAGDLLTGVTIMKMDAELDHGPIIASDEEPVLENDTGGFLHDRLALLGGRILPDTLAGYLEGKLTPRDQDHAHATTCSMLTRDDGKIDWNMTSEEIERMVRAYNPWPGAWMKVDGKRLKIHETRVRPNDASYKPGVRFVWKGRPSVKCGQGSVLELVTVQPEGKKPMSGVEFIRGERGWMTPTSQGF